MKLRLSFIFIAFVNVLFAQPVTHQPVAGTKYSLIPPGDFTASSTFSGFENAALSSSIILTEIPASFEAINKSFTAEALKTRGMVLISIEKTDFNKLPATFITLSQEVNGTKFLKQILAFGDDKKSILVNGIYPEKNKAIEAEIKTSLLSIQYNENQKDDPLAAVKFTIDVSGSGLHPAKYMMGSIIYTHDGKIPTQKPSLLAGNSISKVVIENRKEYAIKRFKELQGGEMLTIKENNAVTIDKLPGFEIIANGKNKEQQDELIYQVMLFTENNDYFIIVGMAKENITGNLTLFKKIATTFKQK